MEEYQIERGENIMVLRTASFRAEKGSVLHSGIYNRELASSLAAGGVIIVFLFFFGTSLRLTALHFMIAVLSFGVFFVLFRVYVFSEPVLETVIDRDGGTIKVSLKRKTGTRVESFPVKDLTGIRIEHTAFQPDNADGVAFVEKIALQHGTVIPGFGKRQDFYTVRLDFCNAGRVVFSTKKLSEAEAVMEEMKAYLNGFHALSGQEA
jgi:hypothetical protein